MKDGYSDVLIGLQYGDEGKGRIIDNLLAEGKYAIVARFGGGSNAGHTVQNGGQKLVLRQVPSGVFHDVLLYVGSGCVVNPIKLVEEIQAVNNAGIDLLDRLHLSPQATLVLPHHIIIDEMTSGSIGTTGQGIGPAYADRALRAKHGRLVNHRLCDLTHGMEKVVAAVRHELDCVAETFKCSQDMERLIQDFERAAQFIATYIDPNTRFMECQVSRGAGVLFEGAQSAMLDPIKGHTPFVTSGCTGAAAAYVGGDLPLSYHRNTFGVIKTIMTRMGHGPFPSEYGGKQSEEYCLDPANGRNTEELLDPAELLASGDSFSVGQGLRLLGLEYGAYAGTPRRMGMLDLFQLSCLAKAHGVTGIFVNKMDCLPQFAQTREGKIPVVVNYKLDGKKIDYIPAATDEYAKVSPVQADLPAFSEDISALQTPESLPPEAKAFLSTVANAARCHVLGIGVGPRSDQFLMLKANG